MKRNGTVIPVNNAKFGGGTEYIGKYERTNAGHTIGHFDGIFDDGAANVSGLTIQEISTYFSSLTLRDFTERKDSSYTIAGDKFNLMPPSIQDPVAIYRQTTDDFGTHGYLDFAPIQGPLTIEVYSNISYFPNTGYLLFVGPSGQYSICQYGSKDNSAKTFTDITYVRGTATTLPPDTTTVIPYSID